MTRRLGVEHLVDIKKSQQPIYGARRNGSTSGKFARRFVDQASVSPGRVTPARFDFIGLSIKFRTTTSREAREIRARRGEAIFLSNEKKKWGK